MVRKVLLFLLLLVAFLCLPGGCDRREDEVSEAMLRDIGPPGYGGWVERSYDPNVDKWSVVAPPGESDWEAQHVFFMM